MTIGTGAFYPGGRFTFPRSYLAKVENCSAGFSLVQTYNKFSLSFAPAYVSVYHWTFDERFWVWTSNVWTLDHIITECYYEQTPDPTQIPLNFGLYWVRYPPDPVPQLQFAPNLSTAVPIKANLPAQLPGYWTRPT